MKTLKNMGKKLKKSVNAMSKKANKMMGPVKKFAVDLAPSLPALAVVAGGAALMPGMTLGVAAGVIVASSLVSLTK